ncbi:MAG: hypothetical protein KAH31_03260 [Candidatus Sabulitectum sp.]|nr:hypothetical protein [Candidatus Sabulitectum sp.]
MNMNIKQAPFNSSLMGVIRGVADYFDIDLSTPSLYGRTGHAFFMNIHEAICPSGPCCWNIDPFISLLENCGIRMKKHGFFSSESSLKERNTLEKAILTELGKGNPCSVLNMDYQLITGSDGSGFLCTQPWERKNPPAHLSFGSWDEWEDEIHASFYSFEKMEFSESLTAIQESLGFIADLNKRPSDFTMKPYTSGVAGYDVWVKGIKKGYGAEHGNWWNGTVWSECRKQGALYFGEISEAYSMSSLVTVKLQDMYDRISEILLEVSDKKLSKTKKIEYLKEARELEEETIPILASLTDLLNL